MTVALVVATAAACERAGGPPGTASPGAPPAGAGGEGCGVPGGPRYAAALPLAGLRGGEVTTQPLLTRLCGQLGALGVRDIVLLVPAGRAGALATMASDGLSLPGSLRGPGRIDVIECGSVADELQAVALVARRVGTVGGAVLVCAGDLVAHTEALARLSRSSETAALTAAIDDSDETAGPDLPPALRLAPCGQAGGAQRVARHRGGGRIGAAPGGGHAGHEGRWAVVAAGSAFHRVHAPNAAGCGAFMVSAADMRKLAAAASELTVLATCAAGGPAPVALPGATRGHPEAAGGPGDLGDLAGRKAAAVPAIRPAAAEPPQRYRPGFADSSALLLVGLVRSGAVVEALDTGPLVCRRVQTARQATRAAAELGAVDEDRVRLDAAVRPGGGVVATCLVNPYAKHLARWAHGRRLTPNALTGMSISSGLLAALWFSAGSGPGVILGAAFGFAGFVLGCADGQLARYARQQSAFGAWLHAVGGRLAEYAVYAGLAAGATTADAPASPAATGLAGAAARHLAAAGFTAPTPRSIWELAVAAMILQSLRDMIALCARAAAPPAAAPADRPRLPLGEPADFATPALGAPGPYGGGRYRAAAPATPGTAAPWPGAGYGAPYGGAPYGGATHPRAAGRRGALDRKARALSRGVVHWLTEIIAFQPGERIAVIAITAIAAGARFTFLALLAWGIAAACLAVIRQMTGAVRAPGAAAAGGGNVAAYRDDGIAARSLGRFVNGALPPLLPAAVAAIVTVILTAAGIATLPGPLVLAPVVVMALAALGSWHAHDRRFDWLVPPLLLTGEYVFIAALGLAGRVPLPLLFAVVAAIAAHRHGLACRVRQGAGSGGGPAGVAAPLGLLGTGLGWEGRMLAVAVGAMLHAEPFTFAVLAVYLWMLFGWAALNAWAGASHPGPRVTSAVFRDTADAAVQATPGGPASPGRQPNGSPRRPGGPRAGLEDGGGSR